MAQLKSETTRNQLFGFFKDLSETWILFKWLKKKADQWTTEHDEVQ